MIIDVIVKDGHEISDMFFYRMHSFAPYKTEYLAIVGLSFETNIVYLN